MLIDHSEHTSPSDQDRSEDPRVRAARTKRDRTRRALLDAAEITFETRGWARTRMEDIARAAEVSAATAYNHFPTKHALLGHVYRPVVAPLAVQAERDLAAGRPIIDAMRDQVVQLARVSARRRTLTSAFWSAVQEFTERSGDLPVDGDETDPRVLAPIPAPLRLLIERGQAAGELRPFPPARDIAGIVVNLFLMRAVNRPTETPAELAELLLTVMFGVLKPELLVAVDCAERPFAHGYSTAHLSRRPL